MYDFLSDVESFHRQDKKILSGKHGQATYENERQNI